MVNACENKKKRQIVPVLNKCLEKVGTKPNRLVLSVLASCEKEAYSMTGMENNLR